MRLFAQHYLSTVASLGSPGVDELRRLSRSDPGRGIVRTLAELVDQDGSCVLRVTVINLLRTRRTARTA